MSYGPEMINELKRLQNVITNLDGMIAQQIISNTNLTNMIGQQVQTNTNLINTITELQNQVAQQTITNTNLVNSIATLTIITGQLVTVNTRALDEQDQAHIPLGYTWRTLAAGDVNIADGGSFTDDFTDANWGAGLDFFPESMIVDAWANGVWLNGVDEGMLFNISVVGGATIYYQMFTPKDIQITETAAPAYVVRFTRPIVPSRVQTGQTLRCTMQNYAGVMISNLSWNIFGYAV